LGDSGEAFFFPLPLLSFFLAPKYGSMDRGINFTAVLAFFKTVEEAKTTLHKAFTSLFLSLRYDDFLNSVFPPLTLLCYVGEEKEFSFLSLPSLFFFFVLVIFR